MMADAKPRTAIPAWQRAQQPQQVKAEDTKDETNAGQESKQADTDTSDTSSSSEPSHADQLENMKSFLEDPAVKDAPAEKKRAFFESKGISKDLIDEVLRAAEDPAIQLSDFESFRQQQQQQQQRQQQQSQVTSAPSTTPQRQQSSAPPIITYPEFLVEAHKPPPLITLGRIWNTAQIASGLAAIVYGASKYLVTPMTESLNEARHDFATHSQSKIDELNDRISKLVSKQPEPKKEKSSDFSSDDDETSSSTSDPTELFHRDMGTQTSPPETRRSSTFGLPGDAEQKKSPTDYQVTGLEIMKSHLDEMLERTWKLEGPNKERQEKMNNLRHYLDTLMYASPGISVWSSADDFKNEKDGEGKEDAVEELKREIRGVKGVMLSAKRFPGVGSGRAGGGG